MERDFANLSEKYIAVTKLMNELQSKVDGLTGEGGGVNELREQVKNLQDTWQQLQSKAGVMYLSLIHIWVCSASSCSIL